MVILSLTSAIQALSPASSPVARRTGFDWKQNHLIKIITIITIIITIIFITNKLLLPEA